MFFNTLIMFLIGGGSETCDLSCIAQQLWNNDINKLSLIDMYHNFQSQTSSSGTADDAPSP